VDVKLHYYPISHRVGAIPVYLRTAGASVLQTPWPDQWAAQTGCPRNPRLKKGVVEPVASKGKDKH